MDGCIFIIYFSLGVNIELFIPTDLEVHSDRYFSRTKVFAGCPCSRYFNRQYPDGFFTEQEKGLFKHSLYHLFYHDIHHNHI